MINPNIISKPIIYSALNALVKILAGFFIIKLILINGNAQDLFRYGQIQSVLAIFTTISIFGLGHSLSFILSNNNEESNETDNIEQVIFICLCGLFISLLILWTIPDEIIYKFLNIRIQLFEKFIISILLPGFVAFTLYQGRLISTFRSGAAHKNSLASNLLAIFSALLIAHLTLDCIYFIYPYLFLVSSSVLMIYYVPKYNKSSIKIIKICSLICKINVLFQKYRAYPIYTIISLTAAQFFYMHSRSFIADKMSNTEAGNWQALITLSGALNSVLTVYLSSYFLSNLTESVEKNRNITFKAMIGTICFFITLYMLLILFDKILLEIIFSADIRIHSEVLVVFSISEVLRSAGMVLTFSILKMGSIMHLILLELFPLAVYMVSINSLAIDGPFVNLIYSYLAACVTMLVFSIYFFYTIYNEKAIK